MIRVVSFDIWNTLLDIDKFYKILSTKIASYTKSDYEEIYRKILDVYREAQKRRLAGDFKRIIIDSAEFFSKNLGIDTETLFRALVASLRDEEIRELAYEDVYDALEGLRRRGLRIACLGNVMFWPGMVTRYILDANNLLDYFDATIFSDEIGFMKPSKEIFEYLAQRLGVGLEEVLHVGDSLEHDFAGSLLAGVATILVRRGVETEILRLGRRAYVINDLRLIERVLSELDK